MVLILIAAAVVSAFLGKPTETVAISAIVILFGVLGFVQEYRAEQAMAALKQLAVPVVRVRRGGSIQELSARQLVPGDIVLLEAGNMLPADLRLLESANLFTTIVSAVEEGRVIYDNIRRFVKFSIAGNLGKVVVMLLAPLLGINVALLPLQLLWLNLLTDGLLGLGLGVEPPEPGTMRRPPRPPQASLFSEGIARQIVWVGILLGALGLAVGGLYFDPGDPAGSIWQTMIFTTLAFMQIGQALATRATERPFASLDLRNNPLLLLMVLLVFILQLLVIYVPFLDRFFNITPLPPAELLLALALGGLVYLLLEIEKWWLGRSEETDRQPQTEGLT